MNVTILTRSGTVVKTALDTDCIIQYLKTYAAAEKKEKIVKKQNQSKLKRKKEN